MAERRGPTWRETLLVCGTLAYVVLALAAAHWCIVD